MSLDANDTFEVNRGSDLRFSFVWLAGVNAPLDLTDYTVDGYDVDPGLASVISFEITDAPAGEITVTIEWDESLESHRVMGFRVRITRDELNTTTNLLKVTYK